MDAEAAKEKPARWCKDLASKVRVVEVEGVRVEGSGGWGEWECGG